MITPQQLGTSELLYRCAQEMGLDPSWITSSMFAVTVDGHEKYVHVALSPLNSHTSANLAKNKHLTRLILDRHNMPNIPFMRPQTQQDASAFLLKYKKIIAKPIKGSGSQDIHIIIEAEQLKTLHIEKYILEKYITGQEIRYLVLNDTVLGVYQSNYGTSVKANRELQCISHPAPSWSPALVAAAVQTTRILGLKFAAVDYLVTLSGRAYILEVNTCPDLKWFHAPTSGPAVNVARPFMESIFESQKIVDASVGLPPLGVQPTLAYT